MTTPQLIDMIIEYIGSELTRPRALVYLNNAQNSLLLNNNRLMRIFPDPFLTTVAGTFNYVASTSIFSSDGNTKGVDQFDVYNVQKIYSFSKDNSIFFRYNGVGNSTSSRQYRALNNRASDEVNAPADTIKSIAANSEDCLIKWWGENDPGATTEDWHCEAYRYPNQLTTEQIPLETPVKWHDTLLLWMVLKRLGIRQYGTTNIDKIIDPELREFKLEILTGSLSRSSVTTPREV